MRYCFEAHCKVNLVHLFSSVLSRYLDIGTRKRGRFLIREFLSEVITWLACFGPLFSCNTTWHNQTENTIAVNQAKAIGKCHHTLSPLNAFCAASMELSSGHYGQNVILLLCKLQYIIYIKVITTYLNSINNKNTNMFFFHINILILLWFDYVILF